MRGLLCVFLLSSLIVFVIAESPNTNPSEQENDVTVASDVNAVEDGMSTLYARMGGVAPPTHQPRMPTQAATCYSCIGCNIVTKTTPAKVCPLSTDFTKNNKCVVYEEKYSDEEMVSHIRGCATERDSCNELKRVYQSNPDSVQLVSCKECEGDRCNKGALSCSLSDFIILVFLIIVPFFKKIILS